LTDLFAPLCRLFLQRTFGALLERDLDAEQVRVRSSAARAQSRANGWVLLPPQLGGSFYDGRVELRDIVLSSKVRCWPTPTLDAQLPLTPHGIAGAAAVRG
jgi:hypothetical protein